MRFLIVLFFIVLVVVAQSPKKECTDGMEKAATALALVVKKDKMRHQIVDKVWELVKNECEAKHVCDQPCSQGIFACLDKQYDSTEVVVSPENCCGGCPGQK
ncbi:unnamed protein product [Bursaphelenchus okinawaensis]|uniref:Uncharacterized protein n=1 Tax=Bursaphelenchus okinawaensis TaxID=465554 RepID=A0A811K5X8_9BILA|nr:unnamed protein product [Bursaphelenchus okinawaensis]CAG9092038.1 unnamed protein product [Bursaphelenchus okinawaensis]